MNRYKSIKVKEAVYDELKKMGKGIGGAVELLVKSQQEEFEQKLVDIEEAGDDIAQILFESGIFDISFVGAGVEGVEEDGTVLSIKCHIKVDIPSNEVREQIIAVLTKVEEEENGE